MKNLPIIILAVILGLGLVYPCFAGTGDEYVFEVTLPPLNSKIIEASDDNSYLLFSLEDEQFLTKPGFPKLPVQTFKVHVPEDAKDIKVEAVNVIEKEKQLKNPIYPAEKPVTKTDGDISYIDYEFALDQKFYEENNAFYPAAAAEISESANLRGFRYIVVETHPLQYRPKDNVLKITESMTIKVSWKSSGEKPPSAIEKHMQNAIQGLEIKNYSISQEAQIQSEVLPQTAGEVTLPGADLAQPFNTADYLIITANQFFETPASLEQLVNFAYHKASRGYNVAIVKLSDIYAQVGANVPNDPTIIDTGDDSEIKTLIKYAYDYWDNGAHRLKYVLLVGDAYPDTASYYLPFHTTLAGVNTDYWYSCINDDNLDAVINDDDAIGDLAIGRFSVQTESELSVVVAKTINYESIPAAFPALLTSGIPPGDHLGNLMPGVRDAFLIPNHTEVNEIYADKYDPLNYAQARQDILTHINNGNALFAVTAHGTPLYWRIGAAGNNLGATQIAELANVNKLPFIFSMSCSTAQIDYYYTENPALHVNSLAEEFVNTADKGAVAFYGATGIVGNSENTIMINAVIRQIFDNGIRILGDSILQGKIDYNYDNNHRFFYNLIGDPALDISAVIATSSKPELTGFGYFSGINGENMAVFLTTIKNLGLTSAIDVKIELFQGDPANGGTLISDSVRNIPLLSPQVTIPSYEIQIPLQPGWEPGFSTVISLVLDGDSRIDELSEYNNVHGMAFHIDPPAPPPPTIYEIGDIYYDENYGGPAIYGNKIVWVGPDRNVYLYDLGRDGLFGSSDDSGRIQITEGTTGARFPSIYKNKIIWQGYQSGFKVYLYDLGPDGLFGGPDDSGIVQIASNAAWERVGIYENKIVWVSGQDLYLFDGAVTTQITHYPEGIYAKSPAIYGKNIVWQEYLMNFGGYVNMCHYDLDSAQTTQIKLLSAPGYEDAYFHIYKNKIVWQDLGPSSNWDIYLFDLGPDQILGTPDDRGENRIPAVVTDQKNPAVFENTIVFQDALRGRWDINYYDLGLDGRFGGSDDSGQRYLQTTDEGWSEFPAVYDNKLIFVKHVDSINNKLCLIYYKPPTSGSKGRQQISPE